MKIRARFRVISVAKFQYPGSKVELSAVGDKGIPDAEGFSKYTPNGSLTMTVDNPAAESEFTPGDDFYLEFTKVPKPEETPPPRATMPAGHA